MKIRAILILAPLAVSAAELKVENNPVIAHEWGTFTSVAGEDGNPVQWAPLFGAADLPCFVRRFDTTHVSKWQISGLVRMETPVLYFYSQRPLTLSVHVDFPRGLITEWYPQASKVTPAAPTTVGPIYQNGSIAWDRVSLLPGEKPEFPSTIGSSRYYAARQTDSVPLGIGTQHEKLIFYRGVGNFPPPLRPRYGADGTLEIRNAGTEPIPLAILFQNHKGKIGYKVIHSIRDAVTVDPRMPIFNLGQLSLELKTALVEFGLYPKEASAMLETWRDSWFEEGTRVLYIMPRQDVDSVLPLTMTPEPERITRVFVGRAEVLSPGTKEILREAVDRGDASSLQKFGRFLDVYAQRLKLRGAGIQSALASLAQAGGAASCIP
jgi:hypothetical protein